ncbi:aldose 1-epimerase family protein [Streptomyces sp. SR27]|uniref:aldose 1-epimerase family protein n=1 Tax=unclassified Streptomyces TaxID=2593676 RepID=UPI00295BD726|nr:aldose 1-epimerase family protein [Streptomyces sp. SR27]MDV9186793.1 aldose 1-epimerase family protein [Streptomyces sp. SR27]
MQEYTTGRQLTLRHGAHHAVVVELGAALRSYSVGERALVDGFAPQGRITGGRGQLLVPWPNRIRDGRYRWHGQDLQMPLTEPESGNAIHGLLRWTSWQVVEASDSRAVLDVSLWPQPGYPFHLHVRAEYTLGEGGLEVAVTARNLDTSAAPYGVGQHPYIMAGTAVVDESVLTVPARTWLRTDERGLPVSAEPVAGTPYDLRTPQAVGARRLDTPFGDLDRDADGRAVVRLAHPSGDFGTDVWLGEGADYVQLYTGDTLPAEERRRAIAVEPMSCPPDAFRSGTGLVDLLPGEQHTVRWGITPWGE